MTESPPLPEPPDDATLEALLGEALAEEEAGSSPDGEAEEILTRIAAGEAARDPGLRRVLAEVADGLAAAAEGPAEVLGPDLRAAARLAFVAARPAPVPAPAPVRPARVPLAARAGGGGLLRWAALLVLALGAGLLGVLSSPQEAAADLRLGARYRLDLGQGRQEAASGGRLAAGERIEAAAGEVLGLRLMDGGALELPGGAALRVEGVTPDGESAFALESGAVRLAVGAGGLRLRLGDDGTLVLGEGRAWVSLEEGLLALGPTARGAFEHGAGRTSLEGPYHATLGGSAGLEPRAGRPAEALFRMPALFGAEHVGRAPGQLVAARRWRVLEGEASRRGTSLVLEAPAVSRLAWDVSPFVRRARALRLTLEGPAGCRVALEGLDAGVVLGEAPASAIPGLRRVDLPLPADWYERLKAKGGTVVLRLAWPEGAAGAMRFDGASFLAGTSERIESETTNVGPPSGAGAKR